jgi:gliding motility-associated-like protein
LNNWKNDVNRNINSNEQGFLGKKLEAAEWPVDPAVWQAVSAQVSASATAGGAAASAGIFTKIALWVGAAAIAVATVVVVVRETKPDPKAKSPAPVEQSRVEAPTVTPAEEATSVTSAESLGPEVPASVETSIARHSKLTQPEFEPSNAAPRTAALENTTAGISEETPIESQADQAQAVAPTQGPANQPKTETYTTQKQALTIDFDVVFDEYDELEVQFNAILPRDANCEWDFGDGNRAIGSTVSHRFEAEGSYVVKVFAQGNDGSEGVFEAEVDVFRTPKLILPNIFTPNNDGRNDFLTVAPDSQNITVERMVVIDGSGSLVYEAIGANARWDGTLQSGEPAPAGSYRLIVSAVSYSGERMHESAVVRLER